jgi:large subunit ribosomal protein L23
MIARQIIHKPLITEKSNIQKEKSNQVSFVVDRHANRVQIRKAVEQIFGIQVLSVRTMQIKGKVKRRGRVIGKRKDWKKAIVKMVPGSRIEFFDGV